MAEPTNNDAIVRTPVNVGLKTAPAPQLTTGLTWRELGQSGLRAFSGYVREDFNPALQGRQAQTIYREMRDNSTIIGGMIFAMEATMGKVEWRVNPAADTPEAQEMAEFVDSLREDMGEQTWNDFVMEALSMLPYGFAPMELNYKRRLGMDPGMDLQRPGKRLPKSRFNDGRIGWKSLPLRGQDTILKWFFDENGEITGLTQLPYVGPMLDIPAEKFMLFRPTQHKNNPEGRSILRNAFRDYLFVRRIEEQEAILGERLNGVPLFRLPTTLMELAKAGDADAVATVNGYKQMAINLRIDEQMGIVMPSDVFDGPTGPSSVRMYDFELVTPGQGAGSADMDKIISRHQTAMMMSVLADFLSLGHSKTGTQALAVAKQDMFFQAVETYLNSIAATVNRTGLTRLWELNGFDPELMPEITPDLAQRIDLDVLSNFVLRLSQSGMAMFPNSELQSALLDAAGLPDIADMGVSEFLTEMDQQGPMPIVGPGAALLMPKPEPAPGAADEEGSPKSNFEKIIKASYARRFFRINGEPAGTVQKRKKRLPRVMDRQSDLFG